MTQALAARAARRRGGERPGHDRLAWPSSLALGLAFTAVAMAVSFWWFRVVDGEGGWLIGPDLWGITDAGRTIYSGAIGWVYHTPYEIYALPLGYAVVAPAVWVADHYNLAQGAPMPLPYPKAWLVVGPYTYMLGVLLLHAVRLLATTLGIRRRRWLVQLLAVALVLVPCAYWNHPEDVLALAATVHALRYARSSRWTAAAVALGVAISCKQWSLVALPFLLVEVPAGRRRRCAMWALVLPGWLAAVCLAADPHEAARHLLAPKLVPASMDPGHHAVWADALGHATSRLSRGLELGIAPLVAWRYRSADWATRTVALGVVLMARPVLEPYSFAYYWAPGLLVTVLGLLAARGRLDAATASWPVLLVLWTMPGDSSTSGYLAGLVVIAGAWALTGPAARSGHDAEESSQGVRRRGRCSSCERTSQPDPSRCLSNGGEAWRTPRQRCQEGREVALARTLQFSDNPQLTQPSEGEMTNTIKQLTGRDEEEGFTLIELMVVVLIIGILMAIAIPTFLGAKNSANARAAQSNLRNSITAEQSYFSGAGNQNYGAPSAISSLETAITFNTMPASTTALSLTGNNVYVDVPSGATNTVVLGAKGADGNCYWAYDNNGALTYDSTGSTCTEPATSAITATHW